MIEDLEMHKLFEAESAEHLACLDNGLLRLEKTPTDLVLLEELFRESHSLKGAARMLGLSNIEAVAHGLESIFNAARKGDTALTPEVIEQMNSTLLDLRQRVQEALTDTAFAMQNAELASTVQADISPVTTSSPQPDVAQVEIAKSVPSTAQSSEPFSIDTVRVQTRKLDELLTQTGELSVIQGRTQHRLALMEELLDKWTLLERVLRKRRASSSTYHADENEAVLHFGSLLKQTRNHLFDDSARLESTMHLVEDQVRSIRLLPLFTVFALFPRMLRDLAKEQGKEAELIIEGGDINVDKRILEEIKDPLMHLIRNAIDHGIETPIEREQQGKPRSATVRLRATRENASVLLEVQDNGRGLDLAAILQEAKKRGLHDEAILSAMTPTQLQQLILAPGFSTSHFVTELSGRGVGLDVVRVNVERMKGNVHLQSTAGQGLTVQLSLPLSLTTTQILLANVGGGLYGLPVESIHTSRRVREEDIFTLEGRLAVLLDGQPVMVARLADLLELPAMELATPGILACIVIQVGDELIGLLADDLLAEEEVVPKPPGPPLRRVRNVSALAMLGSGKICSVLNPADLLRSAHKGIGNTEFGLSKDIDAVHPAPRPAHSILLVEDSAMIRAMEKRILEDGGYEVVATVDGVDALNALASRSFSAVVSDITMPNMDGLTLTTRIRAQPHYKELPLILVTSLASDEDKRRGLDAGANAYIPKPTFDQRVLLETLTRLI